MGGVQMYVEDRSRSEVGELAERLYRDWRRLLLAIARQNTASREDAEDAVQFSLSALIEKYDPAGGSPPLAWVTLVLQRRCWAFHRCATEGRAAFRNAVRIDRP
jgi:DNA-directed RNA polymerase specialized sigma24 family protein